MKTFEGEPRDALLLTRRAWQPSGVREPALHMEARRATFLAAVVILGLVWFMVFD